MEHFGNTYTETRKTSYADRECVDVTLLRPKEAGKSTSETKLNSYQLPEDSVHQPELGTYRVFHLKKTQELLNTAFKEHTVQSHERPGDLVWDLGSERQYGLG